MKILYAIQGTGNGHVSRANDIVPVLQKKCDVDILVSGIQVDVSFPFNIHYRLNGMSFIFGKKGGVDVWQTWKRLEFRRLLHEIKTLRVEKYDLIINDFEPVSAWAARIKKVPCISLSHQSAVLNKNAPKPRKSDLIGKAILRYYAPTQFQYGFHFEKYDQNIFTPVIRNQVRDQKVTNEGHYTVYLPSYGDEKLINTLSQFGNIRWEVFSKHSKESYRKENVFIFPIDNDAYISSMARCEGVLCGAGFEGPAEAMVLGKKVMVIPMKTQYEQKCNAAALQSLGVPVLSDLSAKNLPVIQSWLISDEKISVDYPDITEEIIDQVLETYSVNYLKMANLPATGD